MRKLAVVLATSVAMIGAVVGVAVADPGLEATAAFTPHEHFVKKADGTLVKVGPRVCDMGANSPNWGAFLQFHSNHHTHGGLLPGGPQGPVTPGLHNTKGPELVPGPCPA